MKKIIYFIAMAVLAVSCSMDDMASLLEKKVTEGEVTLTFDAVTTDLPAVETRAVLVDGEDEIRSIKVVVYDENGMYVEQTDAVLNKDNAKSGKWQATISLSAKKRQIHFLANYNGEIPFGTAQEKVGLIATSEKAYWQRISVPQLTAIEVGTPPRLELGAEEKALLSTVSLVRNFAKITVSASPKAESNFALTSAVLYNVADQGTMAPYCAKLSDYIDDYQGTAYSTPDALIAVGYETNVPANHGYWTTTEGDLKAKDGEGKVELYTFENERPVDEPAFIIVKGRWNGDLQDTFYKINLRFDDGEYFPILRNFDYRINIKSVEAPGSATFEEALSSPGSGDISTDLKYKSLTNISNGEARIFVDYTERVITNNVPVELKYCFIPDVLGSGAVDNTEVTVTLGDADEFGPVFSDVSCISYDPSVVVDNFTTVTLTHEAPSSVPRKQKVILKGRYTKGGEEFFMTREVTFILMEKPALTVSVIDSFGEESHTVLGKKRTPLTVRVGVPGGLPGSMFPLDLDIEAQALTISPFMNEGSKLPTTTGKSLFGTGTPAFYFTRTVSRKEYLDAPVDEEGNKHFDAKFVTNIDASASKIIVCNESFHSVSTYFINPDKKFGTLALSTYAGGADPYRVLTFTMPETEAVTLTLYNLDDAKMSGTTGSLTRIGNTNKYTFEPTAAGEQKIYVKYQKMGTGFDAQISALHYETKFIADLGDATMQFVGSDYTSYSKALVPGASTTITLRVPNTSCRPVVINVAGEDKTVEVDHTDADARYYVLPYNVANDQLSPIALKMKLEHSEGYDEETLPSIPVWLPVTSETTLYSQMADANRVKAGGWKTRTRYYDSAKHKYIFKGVIMRNHRYNGVLYNDNGVLKVNRSTNATDMNSAIKKVEYFFQSNEENYLRTFDNRYLVLRHENNASFPVELTEPGVESTPTFGVTYYNSGNNESTHGWRFKENNTGTDNFYFTHWNPGELQNYHNPTNPDDYTWNAYPVTVEFVEH